ncbi:hypothetical protein HMPREF9477_01926 [Lachnospiraceae bacterium 2_1_46FAA]|nr:hypothetical protein HMPREF9477_01926 [Lachnospiraceae bacterium 2_1_46FAA]
MILLSISEVKEFMSKLLLSDTFDSFLFIEGEIVTFNTFSINGYLQKDFFDKDMIPERNYSLWKELREYCFSLIRGKRTPLRFKFVFGLSEPNIEKLLRQQGLSFTPQDVQGLYLNISYDGHSLRCVTGTSMNLFTLDKSLEEAWDKMVQKFFVQKEISFELM